MKDSRKIANNLLTGILSMVVSVLLGIVVSRFVLLYYGSEVNGLLSSVTNIYAYIAIVEAGVAAASCQALYKALTEKDTQQANSILAATNKYYHRTGMIYLGLVVIFSVVYPLLIASEIPYYTIVLVILFNGLGNVVNYFFHGKYLIFLKADGKNFIRSGLDAFVNIVKQVLKIVLIYLGYDVIFVQLVAMLASFLQMIYITCYIKKHYSWIDLKCKPDMSVVTQSKHVLVHEVNYLITTNVDVVLLTIFTSLKTVSVYSLYNMLYGTINKVLYTIREAVEFKIAQIFHSDKAKFGDIYQTFETYYVAFSFSLFSIVTYFIQPFLKLYTDGVTDANYLQTYLPVLFALICLLSSGRHPLDVMVQISGQFEKTEKSAIFESVINIVSSVILIQFWGMIGALIGSVIAMTYRLVYLICFVNRKIICRSIFYTCRCWIVNFVVFVLILYLNRYIIVGLDSYIKVFVFCVPYAIGSIAVFFAASSLFMPNAFRQLVAIARGVLQRNKY